MRHLARIPWDCKSKKVSVPPPSSIYSRPIPFFILVRVASTVSEFGWTVELGSKWNFLHFLVTVTHFTVFILRHMLYFLFLASC